MHVKINVFEKFAWRKMTPSTCFLQLTIKEIGDREVTDYWKAATIEVILENNVTCSYREHVFRTWYFMW